MAVPTTISSAPHDSSAGRASDATDVVQSLSELGIRRFSGVPCSILEPLRVAVEEAPRCEYLATTVEGEAVAYAATEMRCLKRV